MNTRWMGEGALLIDTPDAVSAQQLRLAILQLAVTGIIELLPGYNSLLVEFDALGFDAEGFIRLLPGVLQSRKPELSSQEHEIPVRYDGQDLEEVAGISGLEPEEVIRRHSSAVYSVAFLGFAPGFPYMTGLDPALQVPRLKTPRTKVMAGAVAIAGEFAGIYPQATPGGWRILGHTDAVLFDARQTSPARLSPGDRVRFRRQT
ncbi:MAG: 5-oxoprolinase subunit PxpB [Gammaproteobacteria bacterium]|nr:5-oxoprolinase subunit PxpB [Gammaproteobacteria bacterium]MDE2346226.1 5-oxoprolinase subunit PxpB [Gammaproteobacteria bacterium]